jgi:hypothetical protein
MEEGIDASHAPARKKAALDYALEGEITNPHLRAFATRRQVRLLAAILPV